MIPFMKAFLYISAIYSLLALIIYLRQESFIFFPNSAKHLASPTDSRIQEYSITNSDVTLTGWLVNPQLVNHSLIIYYGGNAEDVFHSINEFLELDTTATLLVNYRGYGSSDGKPSEQGLFLDALAIYDDIRKRWQPKQIFLLGRSLGSGIATYVASRKAVQGIILTAPYDSLTHMARRSFPWLPTSLLLKHKFNSLEYVQQIKRPTLIIYGGKDTIIPNKRTLNLIQHIPGPKEVHCITQADHNNISLFPEYWLHIINFLDNISSY